MLDEMNCIKRGGANGGRVSEMPWLTLSRRVIVPILFAVALRAQCPNSIVAGVPSTYAGDGQPATSAFLFQPQALSLDAAGNLYIADSGNNRIRKVTTDGVIHTVAGPDGLNSPQFVLAAPDGSVYIADSGNNRIVQLSTAGVVKVIAGTGHPGYSGDNGLATGAELNYPTGMALDSNGNLLVADTYNSAVRTIDTHGVITTPAWTTSQYGMYTPEAVAIAADGTVFVSDTGAEIIFRIVPDGTMSYLPLDRVMATNLTLLPDGSLLFADGDLIRVSADGSTLSYYARAINALNVTMGVGGIYYTSYGNLVYHAATAASEPELAAGRYYTGNAPDNVSALGPVFGPVGGMVVGPDGSIWISDPGNGKIRKILPNGTERVVSSGIAAGPLVFDPSGNLYAAGASTISKIGSDGTPQLFAGGGSEQIPALGAPAMPATAVNLSEVVGAASDSAGNLYVLSLVYGYQAESLITRITPAGQLTTIWDSTTLLDLSGGYLSTGGMAIDAQGYLNVSTGGRQIFRIATDGSGIFHTINTPDYVYAFTTSRSGEVFYAAPSGRIKALNAGATIFNRDIDPQPNYSPLYFPSAYTSSIAATMINNLLTSPRPGGMPGYSAISGVSFSQQLATDSGGNLYYADPTAGAIRRFAVGSCFTARAPQISVDTPVGPITPQPYLLTTSTTASTTTSSSTTTSTTTSSSSTSSTTTAGTSGVATTSFYAPGELISVFGTGLGPQVGVNAQAGSNGIIGTQLAGTRVLVEGVPAPVLYSSDGRVNFAIPFAMYGYVHVVVQVEYNGALSDAVDVQMYQSAPIVLTNSDSGQPVAVVINQDGSMNSSSKPAAPGSVITFYGSGFGLTSPAGIDGHLATSPPPQPVLPVSVSVDGQPATVLYAGDASGMVEGLVQMNVQLPQSLSYGNVYVTVGNISMVFDISVAGN